MPYKKRVWVPDYFYHITARGNRREFIFNEEKDFLTFLKYVEKSFEKYPFQLSAYCLMSNHYHLLLRSSEKNIPNIMFSINKKYADYYNRKYRCTGHLFEKRYWADPIKTSKSLLNMSSYIHLNPYKAKITETVTSYPWSSMKYFTTNRSLQIPSYYDPSPLLNTFTGDDKKKKSSYKKWVEIQGKAGDKGTWML